MSFTSYSAMVRKYQRKRPIKYSRMDLLEAIRAVKEYLLLLLNSGFLSLHCMTILKETRELVLELLQY